MTNLSDLPPEIRLHILKVTPSISAKGFFSLRHVNRSFLHLYETHQLSLLQSFLASEVIDKEENEINACITAVVLAHTGLSFEATCGWDTKLEALNDARAGKYELPPEWLKVYFVVWELTSELQIALDLDTANGTFTVAERKRYTTTQLAYWLLFLQLGKHREDESDVDYNEERLFCNKKCRFWCDVDEILGGRTYYGMSYPEMPFEGKACRILRRMEWRHTDEAVNVAISDV